MTRQQGACQEPGCSAPATHPTTAPTYCHPHNGDILLRLRRARWGVESRIFAEEAPEEWDISDRTTRAWVKALIGAAINAENELEQWRRGEVVR